MSDVTQVINDQRNVNEGSKTFDSTESVRYLLEWSRNNYFIRKLRKKKKINEKAHILFILLAMINKT